jgi:ribonucleoside-diphosphate reductase alpha chain
MATTVKGTRNSVLEGKEDVRIGVPRYFTEAGTEPFEAVEWETRDALIPGKDGPSFEQRDVEFPKFWSQTATNIVAQKYFRGKLDSPEREHSVRQMIGRVADTITAWGTKDGYFADGEEAEIFRAELTHLLLHQMVAFNSPVWFNVGFEEHPQCSACFILSVEDNMESILDWIRKEGLVFRGGSGSGINLSKLRSSQEQLAKGGYASGPVSFMRGADASAGTIKSGGKTRRAAKMVVLNVDHPDIEEFIWCKQHEEEKARVLQAAGYDMSLDSPDWASIQYQNANNSVRVTDEFMRAVVDDGDWDLTARTDGSVVRTVRARDLMRQIAEAAWKCADPGMHYDTTMNDWHTCPATGRINASNPCSEYLHVDNSACNLASLNLMKFRDRATGEFQVERFERAVDVIFMAQEILVGNSSYPTEEITQNARAMRQLGLGFANLGALLMARGLAYDSEEGRAYAAAISAVMTGRAYRKSAEMAGRVGAFDEYARNSDAMLRVIRKHRAAVGNIDSSLVPAEMVTAARGAWDQALALGEEHGYRNAQAVVIAPTGTISFMMDCDTTGIEPDFSLVKSKRLVGGGDITIVNQTVPTALEKLGYAPHEVDQIVAHVNEHNTVVGAPGFHPEHLSVFDVAVGDRAIHHMGHVNMMAAVQPFVSGAISKTVNLPTDVTVDDVAQLYMDAWKLGVKAIAIYRDGCKVAQPLQTKSSQTELIAAKPTRRVMPIERQEIGRKFQVGEYEGYIHVGLFPEGDPGDIFVDIAKEGTTLAGLMNAFMIAVSVGMQYGVPLEVFVSKFAHMRFEPSGITNDPDIRIAKSIPDYIFRWMGKRFLASETQAELGIMNAAMREQLANGNGHGAGRGRARRPGGSRPGPGAARPVQRLGGRRRVRQVRRPQGPHRRLLHLPRLRRQLRLRLRAEPSRDRLGGGPRISPSAQASGEFRRLQRT